jgi:hypothetical protein
MVAWKLIGIAADGITKVQLSRVRRHGWEGTEDPREGQDHTQ